MRIIGFFWGVCGVIAILLLAIYRISPRVVELVQHPFTFWHWLLLLVFVPYMLYAEGYRGFHCNFAPRVVVRAFHLQGNPKPLALLLAPLFCMGFFYATRRRIITSTLVTTAIVLVVMLVSILPQPWRGIIDAGVIAGLGLGIVSIVYFMVLALLGRPQMHVAADLPPSWSVNDPVTDRTLETG